MTMWVLFLPGEGSNPDAQAKLTAALSATGADMDVDVCGSVDEALDVLAHTKVGVLIADLRVPPGDTFPRNRPHGDGNYGQELLLQAGDLYPQLFRILFTEGVVANDELIQSGVVCLNSLETPLEELALYVAHTVQPGC